MHQIALLLFKGGFLDIWRRRLWSPALPAKTAPNSPSCAGKGLHRPRHAAPFGIGGRDGRPPALDQRLGRHQVRGGRSLKTRATCRAWCARFSPTRFTVWRLRASSALRGTSRTRPARPPP